MNTQIYRMIVKATMTRMPRENEQTEDFFIGFDHDENPYLLLPTPAFLKDNALFAIRLLPNPFNHFHYTLDSRFTRVPFHRLQTFYDDKTYFFGPEENMLQRFFDSDIYKTYTEWMQNIYIAQQHESKRKKIS